jgi:phosphoadenosine phosphosulfate reductase
MSTELASMRARLESTEVSELLAWVNERFGERAALASSFGLEDVVLIDLLAKHAPKVRVFTLDTGRLNEETYHVLERLRVRYGLEVQTFFPEAAEVEALLEKKGPFSFRDSVESRKECCAIRKVRPLRRALAGREAWLTGQRREQAATRTSLELVEYDQTHGLYKLNPLAGWTEAQVWAYVRDNRVPYNTLHDRGYPSIGCAPCTRAVNPGEHARAGRWWWESPESKECGLHDRNPSHGK